MDNKKEKFPLVDSDGTVLGCISRSEAHNGSKKLHPVVHLHVFNGKGHLFLQKRPRWKDIQPMKWDTACGGHVDYGETIEEALRREVREELGILSFIPHHIKNYVFESNIERELVNVFYTIYDGIITPSPDELEDGKFWNPAEIASQIGNGTFTPNFEKEYNDIVENIIPLIAK